MDLGNLLIRIIFLLLPGAVTGTLYWNQDPKQMDN